MHHDLILMFCLNFLLIQDIFKTVAIGNIFNLPVCNIGQFSYLEWTLFRHYTWNRISCCFFTFSSLYFYSILHKIICLLF